MVLKCKICGGDLEINEMDKITVCKYCGTKQTLPRLDDERKLNLYDRANHFRRNNEYDKAMGIYESILNEDKTEAEAYWSVVLCKYGVEYVEDPSSHRRVITCNRTLRNSVLSDEDYKAALQYADISVKELYESDARVIEQIQKNILAISLKEDPYDIFICYKESDEQGKRTRDSVLAQELYQELMKEGYRVFFSRVSLEDKIGTEYEPYIYAALSSAKIMVVIGTQKKYFEAVWVKNEWARFLGMMKEDSNKMLIPAYRDMDPYELPDELLHLQAQDMGKLGFVQDLVHGIGKIIGKEKNSVQVKQSTVFAGETNIENLLVRIDSFIKDGEFQKADEYCEKVLDIDANEARAYIGKLRVEIGQKYNVIGSEDIMLTSVLICIEQSRWFIKALSCADEEYREKLIGYSNKNKDLTKKYLDEKLNSESVKKGSINYGFCEEVASQFADGEISKYKDEFYRLQLKYDSLRKEEKILEKSITEKEKTIIILDSEIKEIKARKFQGENLYRDNISNIVFGILGILIAILGILIAILTLTLGIVTNGAISFLIAFIGMVLLGISIGRLCKVDSIPVHLKKPRALAGVIERKLSERDNIQKILSDEKGRIVEIRKKLYPEMEAKKI